ncbi:MULTISPECIES: 50S ribosomal protein L24 [Ectothiorhodospira]|uniref:50S ribosomal protein L24 n=1 Tax=Ectothiorhodospira TaxID=1051 RepID=UPI0007B440D8|nr:MULTISPECIES: 50S ribosomal protein L24 [Ectothiorhodospira]ANB02273.1 50S ribosomal protein L24 [Ectothiorhodospira sp. BSL-9]MCG5495397.1 50S ribosomal protein L24 [Ectothiorhodospira variabilis]MCG5504995.1 50S ribosomal protein L24 [Ectothiorhodospira variabilis]MCG5508152.1 50S ribosomal protein L24 [Ectothiorhodospira variabilis]
MRRIRQGDDVVVIAGKDKGRRGTVLKVIDDKRVLVQNLNMVKKHQKPNPHNGVQGGIIDKEMPLDVSNVMLYNPASGKGDRVGFRTLEDGRKVRYYKSNNEVVDAS